MRSMNVLAVAGGVLLFTGPLLAGITVTGDVYPDPSTTTSADDVYVGDTAPGSVLVDDGSMVESSTLSIGDDSVVTITGSGSTWNVATLYAGLNDNANATLDILDGAAVNSQWTLVRSTVTVDNATLSATTAITVLTGYSLTAKNNAVITGKSSINGDVTIDGSLWSATGGIGVNPTASLAIVNGGTVDVGFGAVFGTAVVDGAGSVWSMRDVFSPFLVDAMDGSTSLAITGGGVVNVTSDVSVRAFTDGWTTEVASVVVDGEGSAWNIGGNINISRVSNSSMMAPMLAVTNGATLNVDAYVAVNNACVLMGDGSVVTDTVFNEGRVSPGVPVGSLEITGAYDQASVGTLHIRLDSTGNGSLAVTGSAKLAGTLDIDLLNGYLPDPGDAFTIVTGDTIAGTFNTIDLPDLPGNMTLLIDYQPTVVTLLAFAQLTGDANNDGVVDAADFLAVESNMGAIGTDNGSLLGDANDDGRVDGVDWLWVEQHFSAVWQPIAPQTPEPGTLVFLCALLCGTTQRHRNCCGRAGVV